MLFDVFYDNYHVLDGNCALAIFLILANFAAFLDHTKENADVSKNGG